MTLSARPKCNLKINVISNDNSNHYNAFINVLYTIKEIGISYKIDKYGSIQLMDFNSWIVIAKIVFYLVSIVLYV